MTSPSEHPNRVARCKWCHPEGRNKGRVIKFCWLATRRSSGCQLLLQLSLYLEGVAKTFCRANRDVLSAVIVSSEIMMYHVRYKWMWGHSKWSYETKIIWTGNVRESSCYGSAFTISGLSSMWALIIGTVVCLYYIHIFYYRVYYKWGSTVFLQAKWA